MLTWAEQMADATNAAVDPAAFGAVAPTYNGAAVRAVIAMRTDAWLSDAGADITEYRYEALIPEPELSAAPAAGDVLIDGAKTYDTVAPAVLEFGLWRIPLRPRS